MDGFSDSVVDTEHDVSISKVTESSIISSKSDADLSALVRDMSSIELPSGSVYLSNRERLLLRKQALTMKKRSVLSVGIAFGFIFLLPMLLVCSRLSPQFPSLSLCYAVVLRFFFVLLLYLVWLATFSFRFLPWGVINHRNHSLFQQR